MKVTYEVGSKGELVVNVKSPGRESTWIIPKTPKQAAKVFRELADQLDPQPILSNLVDDQIAAADDAFHRVLGRVAYPSELNAMGLTETPERAELRRQAEAASAGAAKAKAIQEEDEGTVAKLPEVMGRESDADVTNTGTFGTLTGPSAAIDGTVYSTEMYRADKSNWVK